ncbi:SGNH/GDSL hydrolase family protein [Agriterribacter sp.]|uniref:SGNH/GDSL hydrolase family protein n=1 Tax=Agriterribacter sp. TaxID=2821509 RepID=UPI002CAA0835|nr:SGNH/GDSL hydrolase family protein [Agriterribacter sp.]HRP54662.1 SGNH/GDSL hydrolase family protein [Agriterribacter sp.]
MIQLIAVLFSLLSVSTVKATAYPAAENQAVLFEKYLNNSSSIPELLLNGAGVYTAEGLNITVKNNLVKLNKFYAVAERKIRYRVKFSADAKAVFRSSEGDFSACVDVPNKRISIATNPAKEKAVGFLQANREYLVEVYHIYQQAKIRIVDELTGEAAEVIAINDGQGGAGQGALQTGFSVGMQWDYYCFALTGGSSMLVKHIIVTALKKKVKLLMYGDSITQPEGYFPTSDFSQAWTQRIIRKMAGNAMSSGRGGAQIDMVLDYIKNELPFIEAKYVMVTIGTNGGNTTAKLTQLVNYIKSQGAIPVLNNIPGNESGTHVTENLIIDQVRRTSGVKGCRFDLATSLPGDGKEVDKSMMYWEDYTGSYGWQIYHHPNEKGGKKMFERTLADMPELYE